MKTLVAKKKRSAPTARKARPYAHHPMGLAQKAQQAEIHRILRSTGAQARLTIGRPNDKYEQEADRIADEVMAMPNPTLQRQVEPEEEEEEKQVQAKPLAEQITPLIQRQVEEEEEEEQVQAKLIKRQAEEEEEPLQAKLADGGLLQRQEEEVEEEEEIVQPKGGIGQTPGFATDLEYRIHSLGTSNQSLPPSTRDFFEPRFGRDFANVRVHTDSTATQTAKAVQAKAFTVGKDVVFGSGQYLPTSNEGKRLLAHELTHVVQQNPALPYTKNAKGYRCDPARSLSASPVTRRLSHPLVIQRDVLDSIGFSLRQSLTRATEFTDPIAKIFDAVVGSNIAVASEITIPASWRQRLLDYSASNLLDGALLLRGLARSPRFYSGGWIMDLQPAAGAMTLDRSIFVPEGRSLGLSTYIHEMVHVAQYGVLGTTNFLTSYFGSSAATIVIRWARGQPTNPMRSSPHEEQAYNLEARFRRWVSGNP